VTGTPTTPTADLPPDPDDTVARFRAGTLPRAAWTHEAHLAVAVALLREEPDVDVVTERLRDLITAYNAHTGTRPDRAACHQTLTAYYVQAIGVIGAGDLRTVIDHPWCSRRAPLRHWSRTLLASEEARHRWVEPDRADLPWSCARPWLDPDDDHLHPLRSEHRPWRAKP
jgi:hypothetical protein